MLLGNHAGADDPDLVRVLPGESVQRSYWISTRRELHKSVRASRWANAWYQVVQRKLELLQQAPRYLH